jgi:hypothetical protein
MNENEIRQQITEVDKFEKVWQKFSFPQFTAISKINTVR